MQNGQKNKVRLMWREKWDDINSNSIFVVDDEKIGMDVGGSVVVLSIREWFNLTEYKPGFRANTDVEWAEFQEQAFPAK